jgi:hypothetical protein
MQKLTASQSAADGDRASEEKVHAEAGRAARKGSRVGSPQVVPIIEDRHVSKYCTSFLADISASGLRLRASMSA